MKFKWVRIFTNFKMMTFVMKTQWKMWSDEDETSLISSIHTTSHISHSSFVGQVAYFITSLVKFDILVLIAQRINSISLCWWAKSHGFKHWYHNRICFGHINNTYHIRMILKKFLIYLFFLQKLCKMEKTKKKKVLEFVYFWSLTAQLFYFIFSHDQL